MIGRDCAHEEVAKADLWSVLHMPKIMGEITDMFAKRREPFKYMKNKYLMKFLCLTLASGMTLSRTGLSYGSRGDSDRLFR